MVCVCVVEGGKGFRWLEDECQALSVFEEVNGYYLGGWEGREGECARWKKALPPSRLRAPNQSVLQLPPCGRILAGNMVLKHYM